MCAAVLMEVMQQMMTQMLMLVAEAMIIALDGTDFDGTDLLSDPLLVAAWP